MSELTYRMSGRRSPRPTRQEVRPLLYKELDLWRGIGSRSIGPKRTNAAIARWLQQDNETCLDDAMKLSDEALILLRRADDLPFDDEGGLPKSLFEGLRLAKVINSQRGVYLVYYPPDESSTGTAYSGQSVVASPRPWKGQIKDEGLAHLEAARNKAAATVMKDQTTLKGKATRWLCSHVTKSGRRAARTKHGQLPTHYARTAKKDLSKARVFDILDIPDDDELVANVRKSTVSNLPKSATSIEDLFDSAFLRIGFVYFAEEWLADALGLVRLDKDFGELGKKLNLDLREVENPLNGEPPAVSGKYYAKKLEYMVGSAEVKIRSQHFNGRLKLHGQEGRLISRFDVPFGSEFSYQHPQLAGTNFTIFVTFNHLLARIGATPVLPDDSAPDEGKWVAVCATSVVTRESHWFSYDANDTISRDLYENFRAHLIKTFGNIGGGKIGGSVEEEEQEEAEEGLEDGPEENDGAAGHGAGEEEQEQGEQSPALEGFYEGGDDDDSDA